MTAESLCAGNTPLTPIHFPDTPGTVWAKEELHNGISGSHYDRLVPMISRLIAEGAIQSDDLVIDASSGSYSNAMSMILATHGISSRFYITEATSGKRSDLARTAGADLVVVPGVVPDAVERMNDDMHTLARQRTEIGRPAWKRQLEWYSKYKMNVFSNVISGERRVYLNHSANPLVLDNDNMGSLAVETLEQLGRTRLDAMVLAIGNFATIASSVPMLKKFNGSTTIFGVEDADNAPCRDDFYGVHPHLRDYEATKLLGTSVHGTPVAFRDLSLLDGIKAVSEKNWSTMQTWFNETYPHLAAGRTSAACLSVAKTILKNMNNPDANVGVILYDGSDKYD